MANFAGTCTSDNKGLLLLLINSNISMDVQEECANRLYRVFTHISNTNDMNIEYLTVY